MVPSHDDNGYFMVAADGGIFAFGDAKFEGSCYDIGGCTQNGIPVAVMPDATGNGYWVVSALGSVYGFGDASYLGAPPSSAGSIASAAATPDGKGYVILDSAGNIYGFGDAPFSRVNCGGSAVGGERGDDRGDARRREQRRLGGLRRRQGHPVRELHQPGRRQ